MIVALVQDREPVTTRAPASVNRLRAALSAIFTFGIREGTQLLAACRASRWDKLYLLVLLAMMTGARKGELRSLRWEWVDFGKRQARLPETKNGESRVLTLPAAAVEELMKFRRDDGLVFESNRRRGVPFDEKSTGRRR